jgi:purine-binding chemotaxis protein CheW
VEVLFFSVGGTTYLARLASLAEVLMPASLRPVPAGPAFVRGLLNLRGHALPVIDLRERLRLLVPDTFVHGNRILRVPTPSGEFGVIVEAVLRIDVLDEAMRRAEGAGNRSTGGFAGPLWAIDGELLQELMLERLLGADEMLLLGWEPMPGRTEVNRLLEPGDGQGASP